MNMEYKKGYEYTIDDDENNEQWFEKESNNYKSTNNVQNDNKKINYLSDKACKFIGSYNSKASCPTGYRNYLGATVGAKSTTLICNDEKIESDKATAVGTINNGKLENIFITNHGSNYKHDPVVKILGDGKNATAQATIKKGKVRSITVTNSGSNYQSTPIIEIEPPNGEVFCHLCCKDFPQ